MLGVTEAAHPQERETRPAIEVAALPPEPDHGHRDFDRSVRIQLSEVMVTTSSGAPPFVPATQQAANWVPVWPRALWHPAYYATQPQFVLWQPAMPASCSTSNSSG